MRHSICLLALSVAVGCGAPEPAPDAAPEAMPHAAPASSDYVPSAANLPSTDLWVGNLVDGDSLTVVDLNNATDRDGYDNQPAFEGDGETVFFDV